MLYLIEGARNSGKTFLIDNQSYVNPFKFPFADWYRHFSFNNEQDDTHYFALAKEIMLHQLNRDGLIGESIIVDRGIITTFVWGLIHGRTSWTCVTDDIDKMHSERLFDNCKIVHIKAENPPERKEVDTEWKDENRDEELATYKKVFDYLREKEISFVEFNNNFGFQSMENFGDVCAES